VFFSIYVGAQFITFGKLFHYTFGADMSTMVVLGGVVVLFYTLLGGFWAVGMTGVIQGVLMVCALALVLAAGLFNAGGINAMAAKIAAVPIAGGGMGGSFLTIVSTLAWGLGYFGMPQVLLRFMAIKRTAMIRPARNIAVIWCFIALASAILIGIAGRAHMPAALPTEAEAENIFILLTTRFFPPLAAGIVLTGILAASMSTCDSQMLIVASSLSNDIFKGVIHKYAGEETVLWIARAAMLITAGFGIVIAISGNQSIFQVVSYAWAGFGASFGPLMLFSLYWKRTTLPAAVAGMLSGGGAVVLWKNLISKAGGVFAVYELLPAFILSSLVIVVVSLLTKKPSPEIEKEFDEAKTAVF
jgi:sodium/proline symporter